MAICPRTDSAYDELDEGIRNGSLAAQESVSQEEYNLYTAFSIEQASV